MISGGTVDKAKIIVAVQKEFPIIPSTRVDKATDVYIKQSQEFCRQETEELRLNDSQKEACESAFLDGEIREAKEVRNYLHSAATGNVAQRLEDGDRFVRAPHGSRTTNSPRAWWEAYVLRLAEEISADGIAVRAHSKTDKGKQSAAAPADAGGQEAGEKDTKIGLSVERLEAYMPSPLDDATQDTAGSLVAVVGYSRTLLSSPKRLLEGELSFEHKNAAGYDNVSRSALVRALRPRKLETEAGVSLSYTHPLSGRLVTVTPSDFVGASPLAKKLKETAEARWGSAAAKIFMESVVRSHFEYIQSSSLFSGAWPAVVGKGSEIFERFLKDPALPVSDRAVELAEIFRYHPAGLIDAIALWAGKKSDEIRTALREKGVDLDQFDKSALLVDQNPRVGLFEALLTRVEALRLTKKFELGADYSDSHPVSAVRLPADIAELSKALVGADQYPKGLQQKEKEVAEALGITVEELKKGVEDYPFQSVSGDTGHDNPWRLDRRINDFLKEKEVDKEADARLTLSAGVKNDFSPDIAPVVSVTVPWVLYRAGEGFWRSAELTVVGEWYGPYLTAAPEESTHTFAGAAKLKLEFGLESKENSKKQGQNKGDGRIALKYTGLGAKPRGNDFGILKHIWNAELRINVSERLYARGGVVRIQQGAVIQTTPGGLNDFASGVDSDGSPFGIRSGRNETSSRVDLGYQVTPSLSIGGFVVYEWSCDVVAKEDCISRSFAGAFAMVSF